MDFWTKVKALMLALSLALAPLAGWAAPARIVVIGDSLTAGYGLPKGEGFVPALQRWLRERGADVRLVNAGLSGDTTYGGRVRAGWALRGGADAVIVELGGNDMLMRLSPERARRNLEAIIATARGARGRPVLVLGIHPFEGEAAWIARWRKVWRDLERGQRVRVVPDIYAGIRAATGAARTRMLQADRIHASRAGVASMVSLAGPQVLEMLAERQLEGVGAAAP